jgi:hypothetical protein
MNDLFESFLKGDDTLWVLKAKNPIFQSKKEGIASLLDYIEKFSPFPDDVTVFDRVVGNAAALLLEMIRCKKIFSSIGSSHALETLNRHAIPSYFVKVVPYILNRKGDGMCPFEQLSIGKSPDEFYKSIIG